MTFALDPELERISSLVTSLPVSDVRLMHDARVLWVMLIPRIADAAEWHHITSDEMAIHGREIRLVSKTLEAVDGASEVINVGMFGHGVRQLHVHAASRSSSDRSWPGIIFMTGPPEPRSQSEQDSLAERLVEQIERGREESGIDQDLGGSK